MTTNEPQERAPARVGWSPAQLAYWFYGVAAGGAVIGQTWVAVDHVFWGPGVPGVARVAAVLPFAMCLELLAMVLSAMADQRMRMGERAYGFRIFSALVALVAVGILVAGHWPQLYWSASFGLLSGSAYLLWLLHSAARRRDALRAAGKLADTAPDYGLWRWIRHPASTARAAQLARQGCHDPELGRWRPLGLFESLQAAEHATRADRQRPSITYAVEQLVRADQPDPHMAELAVRTINLDELADRLAALVDLDAWANRLAPAITAPAPAGGRARTHHAGARPESSRAEAAVSTAPPAAVTHAPVPAQHRPGPATPTLVAEPLGVDEPGVAAAGHPAATGQGTRPAAYRGDGHEPWPHTTTGGAAATPKAFGGNHRATGPLPAVNRSGPAGQDTPGAYGGAFAPKAGTAAGDNTRDAGRGGPPAPTTNHDVSREAGLAAADPDDVDDDRDEDGGVPADTASAVEYWYRQDPSLRPADVAAMIGKSVRTVRRYWPPTAGVNGHSATADLVADGPLITRGPTDPRQGEGP